VVPATLPPARLAWLQDCRARDAIPSSTAPTAGSAGTIWRTCESSASKAFGDAAKLSNKGRICSEASRGLRFHDCKREGPRWSLPRRLARPTYPFFVRFLGYGLSSAPGSGPKSVQSIDLSSALGPAGNGPKSIHMGAEATATGRCDAPAVCLKSSQGGAV
jgi:hypothetical protein